MENTIDYINKIKSSRKKAITITVEEDVINELSEIAEKLDINRNQIINDTARNFIQNYNKVNDPNYYIINSNNTYMPQGHLHMLLGNRASAWGDTKQTIEGIETGDYVFIYMNEVGIVGAGMVKSNYIINDFSLVEYYAEDNETDYDVWDEYFVLVDYEYKSLKPDAKDIDENKVIKAAEFKVLISNKPLNRTKVTLKSDEGEKLRDMYGKKFEK